MSLSEWTRTGLREMPSNAGWLLSRAIKPAAETLADAGHSTTPGARDGGRGSRPARSDAADPGGESLDTRMQRAQAAAEHAREVEQEAVEAAEAARDRAERARDISERGRERLTAVRRECEQHVKQRIAEAQRAADEIVAR